jgi:hypothetical protein
VFAVNNNLIQHLCVDILFETTTSYTANPANYVQIGPFSGGRQKKTKEEAPAARAHFIYASFVVCASSSWFGRPPIRVTLENWLFFK